MKMFSKLILSIILLHSFVISNADEHSNDACIEGLLKEFGYLDEELEDGLMEPLQMGLKLFRDFYNVSNDEALELISKPRCGVADVGEYATTTTKWQKHDLKWRYALSGLTRVNLAKAAFEKWSNVTNIDFSYNILDADIIISDRKNVHKRIKPQIPCIAKLDGPGGVLGHADFPNNAGHGEIHIDESENWYLNLDGNNTDDKINLFAVLLHEIGHALGLGHSKDRDSVMYAFYDEPKLELTQDDIKGIQSLYGVRSQPTVKPHENPDSDKSNVDDDDDVPNLCEITSDYHFLIARDVMFIFHRKWVWINNLNNPWKKVPKPLLITEWLRFLPITFKGISAIYQRPSGEMVLFDGDLVYMFEYPSLTLTSYYPVSITNFGIRHKAKVQAAVNTYAGHTLIFYDDSYFLELNECTLKPKRYGFLTKEFPKLPQNLDSVFRYINGMLYFFKNGTFYEYNEFTQTLVRAAPFNFNVLNLRCETASLSLANVMRDLEKVVTDFNALSLDGGQV
nr:TPA_asm: collagenase [Ladona dragonfly adintovirus]